MKKISLSVIILLLVSFVSLQAQNRKRPSMEKMHEHKWAEMMKQVKLSNEEMALVKPIFMEYEQAIWKIHQDGVTKFKEYRKRQFSGNIDYSSLNDSYINTEIRQAQLLRIYHLKLKRILKPETLFKYYLAERSFKFKLLREMPPPMQDRDEN